MHAVLLHNERAGTAESEKTVIRALNRIGWLVDTQDLDGTIDHDDIDADVIVVAGGDGTVAKVAKRLAGTALPMAIIPMGTANNIARSLGIGVDPESAALALARSEQRAIDLGKVTSVSWTEPRYFVEGMSVGVFADVVAEKATKKDKVLRRAFRLLADELERFMPRHFTIEIDGSDHSGELVLAAVMNTRTLGPTLALAPTALCDDGELDVVLVRPDARRALIAHLRRAASDGDLALPAFATCRAKHVRISTDEHAWTHVDDEPCEVAPSTTVGVEVMANALRVLVPSAASI